MEDDRATYTALRALIAHHGCEVMVATTVADALQALERKPNYVILDLMLPDGDGSRVLRKIRDTSAESRVFVTTGVNDHDRLARINELRPDLLLQKPIDIALLLSKLTFTA